MQASTQAPGPEQFEDWMRKRGFNQAEAARFLEEEESFIHRIRTGKDAPGLKKAIKIQRRTGISCEAWVSPDEDQTTAAIGNSGNRRLAK